MVFLGCDLLLLLYFTVPILNICESILIFNSHLHFLVLKLRFSRGKLHNSWKLFGFWIQIEDLLQNFKNVCTLRVQIPICSDLSNSRNSITKITWYEKVVNKPNIMRVFNELFPILIEKEKRNFTHIKYFTNLSVVSHNKVLQR